MGGRFKVIYRVIRRYNGTEGIKDFNTYEEAQAFLYSPAVTQDIEDGFTFDLIEVKKD